MDQTQLQQKIVEYFDKLPKEAQEVFSSMAWMETLKNVGGKYALNDNQVELLGTETTLVLLGIISINEYQTILKSELNLEKDIVEKIIGEIDDTVLKTIKMQLVETFDSNVKDLVKKNLDPNFSKLPENVQLAIANSDWKNKLYEIAGKYKLTVEQMGVLEEITMRVMNNEIKPNLYENELALKITILREDISNLVNDVNEGILRRIREVMRDQNEKIITNDQLPITNTEEEVPLPPYKVITNDKLIMDKEEKGETTPLPEVVGNRAQMEINNMSMPVIEPKNMMEEKLKTPTVSDHTVSDYSIPKISIPSNIKTDNGEQKPKSFDPYRETF